MVHRYKYVKNYNVSHLILWQVVWRALVPCLDPILQLVSQHLQQQRRSTPPKSAPSSAGQVMKGDHLVLSHPIHLMELNQIEEQQRPKRH